MSLSTIRREMTASLVVFLVALPLSMGIALASGAPLVSGLVAAAVGGIVGGLCGGAPLLVSGPAAGLAVMVFDVVDRFGYSAVAGITVGAGAIQLALGRAKVARLTTAIAPAVLHGMLAGIGVLIAAGQVHVLLGGHPHRTFWLNVAKLPEALHSPSVAPTAIGLLSVAILLGWPRLPRRGWSIPPPLVAVLASTALCQVAQLDVPRVVLPSELHLPPFALPRGEILPLIATTVAMALIASAESLLCAVALDKLHEEPRANLDRELMGQGAANILSGLLGGLPVTGVIVRSTANITAGAKTRWSTVLHGVWIVLTLGFLGAQIAKIPLACLAALLVVVGVRLVDLGAIRRLYGQGEAPSYLVTLVGVVGINLLAGIGLGLLTAVARLFWQLTRARVILEERDGRHVVTVRGAATFLLVPRLTQKLASIPAGANIRLTVEAPGVAHAAREALSNFSTSHRATGGRIELMGAAL